MKAEWLFLVVSWGCLWFVIVVFPDHTHLLFYAVYCKIRDGMTLNLTVKCQNYLLYNEIFVRLVTQIISF